MSSFSEDNDYSLEKSEVEEKGNHFLCNNSEGTTDKKMEFLQNDYENRSESIINEYFTDGFDNLSTSSSTSIYFSEDSDCDFSKSETRSSVERFVADCHGKTDSDTKINTPADVYDCSKDVQNKHISSSAGSYISSSSPSYFSEDSECNFSKSETHSSVERFDDKCHEKAACTNSETKINNSADTYGCCKGVQNEHIFSKIQSLIDFNIKSFYKPGSNCELLSKKSNNNMNISSTEDFEEALSSMNLNIFSPGESYVKNLDEQNDLFNCDVKEALKISDDSQTVHEDMISKKEKKNTSYDLECGNIPFIVEINNQMRKIRNASQNLKCDYFPCNDITELANNSSNENAKIKADSFFGKNLTASQAIYDSLSKIISNIEKAMTSESFTQTLHDLKKPSSLLNPSSIPLAEDSKYNYELNCYHKKKLADDCRVISMLFIIHSEMISIKKYITEIFSMLNYADFYALESSSQLTSTEIEVHNRKILPQIEEKAINFFSAVLYKHNAGVLVHSLTSYLPKASQEVQAYFTDYCEREFISFFKRHCGIFSITESKVIRLVKKR